MTHYRKKGAGCIAHHYRKKGAGCITYRIEYMVWWMVVDGGITLYGMASLYLGSEPLYRSLVAHPGAIE
jgi:hypothetical protein